MRPVHFAFARLIVLAVVLAGFIPFADAQDPKPNVLIILADDLGYSDLGCYGGEIETPSLDRLAQRGLRFTQFYNTARCWPSRAALLGGYYPQQVNRDPQGLRPKWAVLLPELLKTANYRPYHSGKWHVDGPVLKAGFERSYLVVDQDRFFSPKNHQLDDQPLPQPTMDDGYYATTAIAAHASKWLAQHQAEHRESPFFLYLAFTSPHFPLQALPEDIAKYKGRFRDGWDVLRQKRHQRQRQMGIVGCELSARTPGVPQWSSLSAEERAAFEGRMETHAAMVDRMDREIGRVFEQLKAMGQWDNTLIMFLSDNGASAERILRGDGHDPTAPLGSAKTYQCLEPGWANLANTPLRKSKIFVHEGGISTPLIVHWPTGLHAEGELRHTPAHLIDIVPTLLQVAHVKSPQAANGETRPELSGKTLLPAFARDERIEREYLFFKHEDNRALRVGDWKIVASGANTEWELYDLSTDRAEQHDLARQQSERVAALAKIWQERAAEFAQQGATGSPLPNRKK